MEKSIGRLLTERYLLKEFQDTSRLALVVPKLLNMNSAIARYAASNTLIDLDLPVSSKSDAAYWQSLEAAIAERLVYSSFILPTTLKYQLENQALKVIELLQSDIFPEDDLVFAEFVRKGGLIYENLAIYIEVIYSADIKFQTNIKQCSCRKVSCEHRKIARIYIRNRHLVPFIAATYDS